MFDSFDTSENVQRWHVFSKEKMNFCSENADLLYMYYKIVFTIFLSTMNWFVKI